MHKDMMKVINSEFRKSKIEVNAIKNNMDTLRRNIDNYEIEKKNLEHEYSLYRRKKSLVQFKHDLLMILTLGTYTILSKKHYEYEIDDIEGSITGTVFKTHDLEKDKDFNEFKLKLSEECLNAAMQEYEKLEFLLSLSDEEKEKYFNYKMGDNNKNIQ